MHTRIRVAMDGLLTHSVPPCLPGTHYTGLTTNEHRPTLAGLRGNNLAWEALTTIGPAWRSADGLGLCRGLGYR